MNKKMTLLLGAIGLSIGALSAQTIFPSGLPDNLVGTGGSSTYTATGAAVSVQDHYFQISNTGVAIQDDGISRVVANVWETFIVDPNYSSSLEHPSFVNGGYLRSSFLQWRDLAGGISGGSTVLGSHPTGTVFPTTNVPNTIATDPDIEYLDDLSAFFVAFTDDGSNGFDLWIQRWDLVGGTYQLMQQAGVPGTASSSGVNGLNIDFTNVGGAITWTDGNVKLIGFDANLNFMSATPKDLGQGRGPDIAVCTSFDGYYVTYHNTVTGFVDVAQEQYSNLVNPPVPAVFYSTPIGFANPRIASPHNLSGGLNPDEFTVVGGSSNQIVGFTGSVGSLVTPYLVNSGFGSSFNGAPAVAYNSDRIKFIWASDYSGGTSSWTYAPLSSMNRHQDVLLAEVDPFSFSNIYGGYFEINTPSPYTTFFSNTLPSIAETRDGAYPNTDFNAFLYASGTPNITTPPPFYELFNKAVHNLTAPKRLAAEQESNLLLIVDNDEFVVEGENMSSYTYTLVNINGQKMDLSNSLSISDELVILDSSGLTSGIYFLQCQSSAKLQTLKLLVR